MPTTLTLTSSHTEPLVVTVPTKWADVPLATFVALLAPEPNDQRIPAEILCGLDAGTLDQLDLQDVAYLVNLLSFASDPGPVMQQLPTPGLPDLGSLPYGLYLLALQHLEAHPDRPLLTHGPYLLALYRVQLAYGKYDEAKVAACLAALLAAPVTESYGDLSHFLTGLSRWLSGTPRTPKTTTSPKTKKWRQASRSLASGLGRFSRWMRPQAAPC